MRLQNQILELSPCDMQAKKSFPPRRKKSAERREQRGDIKDTSYAE